jgi:predicted acyl esterase
VASDDNRRGWAWTAWGWLLALLAAGAAWAELTAVAAVADTRWSAVGLGGAAVLLFALGVYRSHRWSWPAAAGGTLALAAVVLAVHLLGFSYREVEVRFHQGGVTLAGTLYLPREPGPYAAIVFLHGSGEEERGGFRHYATLFARHGVAALAYDKRGAGESSGGTWDTTYDGYARDAEAALRWLASRDDIDPARLGVLGLSEGGWVAPLVAGVYFPQLSFVIVTSATPLSPAAQVVYETGAEVRAAGFGTAEVSAAVDLQRRVMEYQRRGEGHDELAAALTAASGSPWFAPAGLPARLYPVPEYAWWRSVMDFDPVAAWGEVRCPVLMISGGRDLNSDAAASQGGVRRALAAGGNSHFTGRVFPRMEHGGVEWWLPGRLPPPRQPSGLAELLLAWTDEQVGDGG